MRSGGPCRTGVYDLANNRGLVYLGKSGDTPAFAADAIAAWWQTDGRTTWPNRRELLMLADGGGSNSCRTRAWKERVQVQLCDRFGPTVTVCHSDRMFEVESHRAQTLQPYQQQLGRRATPHVGDAAGLHPRHNNRPRPDRAGHLPKP